MGSLINPLGWRVKYRTYWRGNFAVNNNSFMYAHHLNAQLGEILNSLLRYLNVKDPGSQLSLLALHGHNYFVHHNTVYIILRIRFFTTQLWKLLFDKQSKMRYLKPKYFRRSRRPQLEWVCYYIRRRRVYKRRSRVVLKRYREKLRNLLWRFTKKRVYAAISRKGAKTHLLVNRPTPTLTPRKYIRVTKKMWRYFLILPYLLYMKELVTKAIHSKLSRCAMVKVLFLGLNQRSFNANMIINFIVRRLQYRQFRISRLIYDILRILKRLVRARKVEGYKFLLAGRFSRRDRATYIWKAYSSVPLSTKLSNIDFQYRQLQMRYSLGILKLWISRR